MKIQLDAFPIIPIEKWKEQIAKELKKENTTESFQYRDEIENLTFSITPENYTAIEIENDKQSGDWEIGYSIDITESNIKESNQEALQALNFGANSITFDLKSEKTIDLNILLNEINIEFIDLHFNTKNENQNSSLLSFKKGNKHKRIFINSEKSIDDLIFISSYLIHQIGGNATEEITYLLNKINQTISEQEFESIHLEMGIGNNLMLEIAKFKSIRILINQLFKTYGINPTVYLTAKSGFVNKSCLDPHSNLLRQTTEAFSAILGNVDQLILKPYDSYFIQKETSFTSRMAINISNLLKEEGKLNLTNNPFEGARYINQYIHLASDAAWKLFNKIESQGGINSEGGLKELKNTILTTREKRISLFKNNEKLLIGINAFQNESKNNNQWDTFLFENFLSIPQLILEQELD